MATVLTDRTRFVLDEDRIPRSWYNIAADLPSPPPPPLNPGTGQPIGPGDLAALFPMELIKQVVSQDREIEIPDPVRDAYKLYRPSPLHRARRLEKALDTPAHIYYKYEGGSPSGSHKPNTAIAQAFYNKNEGVTRLATETGAGQWGSALAFAGAAFELEIKVYMVRASFDQKPYRRILMETYGAQVVASPSTDTTYGQKVLAETPGHTGSLGLAISEAIENTDPSEYFVPGWVTVSSIASLIASPSEPVWSGVSARTFRPYAVSIDGDATICAPYVSIRFRRYGFWS